MIKLKAQSSVVALGVALMVILGVYSLLGRYFELAKVQRRVELPVVGRSVLGSDLLIPFRDKWTATQDSIYDLALMEIATALQNQDRSRLLKYLAFDVEVQHLLAAPRRYVGQLIALRFDDKGTKLDKETQGYAQWRRVVHGDVSFEVGLLNSYAGGEGQTCGEFIFLGEKRDDPTAFLLVAKSLYEVAVDGRYPVLPSDKVALSMLVDEMGDPSLQAMARGIPSEVLSHYFAKASDSKTAAIVEQGDYNALMDSPERFRGREIRFTGTLIFKRMKYLSALHLPAGMDMTQEGYLLDSSRALFLFRSPVIPREIKVGDLVTVEGHFLQRTNFLNRMGKATWAPLLVANTIKKEKPLAYGLSGRTQGEAGLIMALVAVIGFWWVMRRKEQGRRPRKRVKIGKMKGKMKGPESSKI